MRERVHDPEPRIGRVADERLSRVGEPPRDLGPEDLVDDDERRHDPARERAPDESRDDRRSRRARPRLGRGRRLRRKLDLGEALGELGRLAASPARCRRPPRPRSPRAAPCRRRQGPHPPPRARPRTARRPARGRARGARAPQPLAPSRFGRPLASTSSSSAASRSSVSRSSDGDLQRDPVRKLREPADVADDERLPEGERADHAARGLAHRRVAQVHAHVGAGHQRPEPPLVDPALPLEALAGQPEALEPAVEVESRRGRADEQQRRVRHGARGHARTRRGAPGCACSS